jgi:hypothetical protein
MALISEGMFSIVGLFIILQWMIFDDFTFSTFHTLYILPPLLPEMGPIHTLGQFVAWEGFTDRGIVLEKGENHQAFPQQGHGDEGERHHDPDLDCPFQPFDPSGLPCGGLVMIQNGVDNDRGRQTNPKCNKDIYCPELSLFHDIKIVMVCLGRV